VTQWRNTAGSDLVLTVAYKIFEAVIGSTGDIINRANPVGAFVGSAYMSFYEVKPPTIHVVKPKALHRASRW
jgi:isocitrate/isopropylmalate dehydrogenase